MSQSHASPSSGGSDTAALRARFDAEVEVAGIVVSADDRDALFTMWTAHQPVRERLSAARIALEEEPSFTQKPAQVGGGLTEGSPGRIGDSATTGGAS